MDLIQVQLLKAHFGALSYLLPQNVVLGREFVCHTFLAEFLRNTAEKQVSLGKEVTDKYLVPSKSIDIILASFSMGTK